MSSLCLSRTKKALKTPGGQSASLKESKSIRTSTSPTKLAALLRQIRSQEMGWSYRRKKTWPSLLMIFSALMLTQEETSLRLFSNRRNQFHVVTIMAIPLNCPNGTIQSCNHGALNTQTNCKRFSMKSSNNSTRLKRPWKKMRVMNTTGAFTCSSRSIISTACSRSSETCLI